MISADNLKGSGGRLVYIDAAKGLGILMIMLGHITEMGNPLDVWMSSVKLCVFYFISGCLMSYTRSFQRRPPLKFIGNLLRTIAWPYVTFSVIAIAVKCYFQWLEDPARDLVMEVFHKNLLKAVWLDGINSMWFLPTVFFGELIIMILFHLPKIFSVLYAGAGLFGLRLALYLIPLIEEGEYTDDMKTGLIYLTGTIGKSIVAAWFIGAGFLFAHYVMGKESMAGRYPLKFCIGLALTVVNIYLSQKNLRVDFNQLSMGQRPYLFVFGGIFGTLGLIWLLEAVSALVPLDPLAFWGKSSLIIMCTHTALGFKTIAYKGWEFYATIPEEVCRDYYIHCFIILAILMFMMIGVVAFIDRFLPFLKAFPRRKRPQAAHTQQEN